MARVPYLDEADLAPADRDLLSRRITLFRALVNSPGAARNFGRLGHWIRWESGLDARLRELAILQVGYLSRSEYEWSHHVRIGREFGLSDADIRGVVAETEGADSGLGTLERAVLRGAREMTSDLKMSSSTFGVLKDALGVEHMIDLVLVVAFYNAVVRVLETLEIDVEPDYEPYLEEFPLPDP